MPVAQPTANNVLITGFVAGPNGSITVTSEEEHGIKRIGYIEILLHHILSVEEH